MNKDNILGIIADHQDAIEKIEAELEKAKLLNLDIPILEAAANKDLAYLRDNKYRYEMQAKKWGLEVKK